MEKKKLSDAHELFGYEEAALQKIHRELMGVNPSAARSLEEGLEETLTLPKLNVPAPFRKTLRSATVRTTCAT